MEVKPGEKKQMTVPIRLNKVKPAPLLNCIGGVCCNRGSKATGPPELTVDLELLALV